MESIIISPRIAWLLYSVRALNSNPVNISSLISKDTIRNMNNL